MTVEVRTVQTEAEKALAEHFDRVLPSLPGGARVRRVRETAFDAFRRSGLPHRRVEEWKYTDLRALMRKALAPAERPAEAVARRMLADAPDAFAGVERYRLVLVDGFFCDALSDRRRSRRVASRSCRRRCCSTPMTMRRSRCWKRRVRRRRMSRSSSMRRSSPTASRSTCRTARCSTGRWRSLHLATDGAAAARHAIRVGAGAVVRIAETYAGPDAAYQTNVAMRLTVGAGATVTYAKLQAEGVEALHLGTTMIALAPGAAIDHLTVMAGARVSRSQIFLATGGEHTRAGLWGASMIGGTSARRRRR